MLPLEVQSQRWKQPLQMMYTVHSLETQPIIKEVVFGGSAMQVQNSRVPSTNDAVPQDHLVTVLWGEGQAVPLVQADMRGWLTLFRV